MFQRSDLFCLLILTVLILGALAVGLPGCDDDDDDDDQGPVDMTCDLACVDADGELALSCYGGLIDCLDECGEDGDCKDACNDVLDGCLDERNQDYAACTKQCDTCLWWMQLCFDDCGDDAGYVTLCLDEFYECSGWDESCLIGCNADYQDCWSECDETCLEGEPQFSSRADLCQCHVDCQSDFQDCKKSCF